LSKLVRGLPLRTPAPLVHHRRHCTRLGRSALLGAFRARVLRFCCMLRPSRTDLHDLFCRGARAEGALWGRAVVFCRRVGLLRCVVRYVSSCLQLWRVRCGCASYARFCAVHSFLAWTRAAACVACASWAYRDGSFWRGNGTLALSELARSGATFFDPLASSQESHTDAC